MTGKTTENRCHDKLNINMKIDVTLGSISSTISTSAVSWYSLKAAAFLIICSASAFALASIAKASASPFICKIQSKTKSIQNEGYKKDI